ncbi:MAG: site-specific DNA-methyltransferase [Spirochaetia bacterium]|nr:site-specific DNA-methyltransferase [Spirochaetia bacterium]
MHSLNKIDENIAKIATLFPNCVTEAKGENGEITHKIDFDMLKQELSHSLVEGREERYQFTWPDKKQAILTANAPINKTLRPCREESVNFDETENLYIEGDNLEVLKLLQETYLGKIKMIYIDPPYNTGNDFVYEDDFAQNADDYIASSGQYDEEGNRLVHNTESNGRFHTDWLNMMYPRLKLARDLLTDNGVIFISIDDYENDNLKKICDEILGTQNFIATVVWQRTYAPISLKKYFSENHEYCLVYAKSKELFKMNLLPRTEKQDKDYKNPDNDPRGVWKVGNLTVGPAVEKQIYPIIGPTGKTFLPPSGYCWRFTKERFESMKADNRIWFGSDGNNSPVPKLFLSEVQNGITPMTLWTFEEAGHGQEATRDFRDLMGKSVFTNTKPLRYMNRFLHIGLNKKDIVLDFFSGSATTAHAVMQLNAEDGGNRKFIMVQLPEPCDEKSEAFKAGYKNICEIGKERIRRAGKQLLKTTIQTGGYGKL